MVIVTVSPNEPDSLAMTKPDYFSVFLAGSIDQGTARLWQDELIAALKDKEWEIFNPRRLDWKTEWTNNSPEFDYQVKWELFYIRMTRLIVFYFDENSKSPITLMELGLAIGLRNEYLQALHSCRNKDYKNIRGIIVCCPKGYWRYGNVKILCDTYGVEMVPDMSSLIQLLSKID